MPDHLPIPAPRPADRVTVWGTFASAESEDRFRRGHARQEWRSAAVLVAASVSGVVLFGLFDFTHFGLTHTTLALWSGRLLFVAVSAAVVVRLRGGLPTARTDRLIVAWSLLAAAVYPLITTFWPPTHSAAGYGVMTVLLTYAMTPVPPVWQAVPAAAHTAGWVVIALWVHPGADADAPVFACALVFANALGFVSSCRMNARRREVYAALLRQAELTAGLEKSLAEVRTLRGLLRVCAWCRKIHTGDEWQQLEQYVREHSHAEFTHGICPECTADQMAGFGTDLPDDTAPHPPATPGSP